MAQTGPADAPAAENGSFYQYFDSKEEIFREVAEILDRPERGGLADATLDPPVAALVLGSVTSRFPEMWFVEGRVKSSFEDGVEQLCRAFINALGLKDEGRTIPGGAAEPRRK